MCHIPSERNILMTLAPNQRPGPLETGHLELSMHMKFKENGARKGLQTAAQRSGQKLEKDKKWLMRWLKWKASISVSVYTSASLPFSSSPIKTPHFKEKSWRKIGRNR